MINKLQGNENITVIWPEDQLENPLIIENTDNSIELYQYDSWISINKNYIPEIIKILKEYIK